MHGEFSGAVLAEVRSVGAQNKTLVSDTENYVKTILNHGGKGGEIILQKMNHLFNF